MIDNELQQIESNLKRNAVLTELGNALARLKGNRDFKKVIFEGFFGDEAIRLVHLKADPNMQSSDSQKAILIQMDAIGALRQYLETLAQLAGMAQKSIEADEQTRNELLAEGL